MNKIFFLNEKNDNLNDKLNNSVQGNVHTFTKEQIAYLEEYYKHYVYQINLQTDLFANIQFPTLPRNFQMLMSELDFPSKSKININNSLLMKPQEINDSSADDIGMQLFNSNKFKDLTGLKMTLNPKAHSHKNESIVYIFDKIISHQLLLESTDDGSGVSMNPQDIKDYNTSMEQLNTDIVSAIKTYVSDSTKAIKPLLEMVGGGSNSASVIKSIHTANEASHMIIADWLDSISAIRKESSETMSVSQRNALKERSTYLKYAIIFCACAAKSNIPNGISRDEFINKINLDALEVSNKIDFNDLVVNNSNFKKSDDFIREYKDKRKPFPIQLKINESISQFEYPYLKHLNEGALDRYEDEESGKTEDKPIDYDKVYHDLFNYLSRNMSSAIGERENWLCFKDVRQNMETLVKGADEEITKKIELVCKTGGQKSLVHWPFKAEGLKSMWKRYMSELQLRINNRIDQLTGSRGSISTGSANMVEQFLVTTYPQIISMMITYKCVFEQLKEIYANGYIPNYTLEDKQEIIKDFNKQFILQVRTFQENWNSVDRT